MTEQLIHYFNKQSEIESLSLSNEYLINLAWLSFKYSQGKPELQRKLFEYSAGQHPHWIISDSEIEKVFGKLNSHARGYLQVDSPVPEAYVHKLTSNRERIDADHVSSEVLYTLRDVQRSFNDRSEDISTTTQQLLIKNIAEGVIERDHLYLCVRGGRNRHFVQKPERFNEVTDPWLSHAEYYAIEGHDPGLDDYAHMFYDVGQYMNSDGFRSTEVYEKYLKARQVYLSTR